MAKNQLDKLVDLKSMPVWRARCEIAKDVIAALKAEKFRAEHVGYGVIQFAKKVKDSDSLRDVMPKMKTCEVCAMGAVFMACIARVNEFDVAELSGVGDTEFHLDSHRIEDKLSPYFSSEQLRLMESVCEGYEIRSSAGYLDTKRNVAVSKFRDQFNGSSALMIGIMKNIIENKGEFIP